MLSLYQQNSSKKLLLKKPYEILKQAQIAEVLFNFLIRIKHPLPVGISENQIEFAALEYLRKHRCEPALKGYRGFPAHISISRNEILAHGIPSEYKFVDDDIVTVDIVAKNAGWFADLSWTYVVGESMDDTKFLQHAAWKVCRKGVLAAHSGNSLNDIAQEILNEANRLNVFVYTQFAGHGIGREIHEAPTIYHKVQRQNAPLLPGMVVCIEPIVSLEKQDAIKHPDGSLLGSKKYKSASYEHMVGIFSSESRVLSCSMIDVRDMPESPL